MYVPAENRYDVMQYRRSGRSGLKLPLVSLGLWHNFGGVDVLENGRAMVRRAFDLGITHFDLANNYGPPAGSAEENFGKIMKLDFHHLRHEVVISTKAGYWMWNGPYGEWGSRKYLISSLDQSLKRMGLDYVDIFYSHRPDPDTPFEETMSALDYTVRSGRAMYVGLSNYNAEQTREAAAILRDLGTPCLIHQPIYNMFNRWVEDELLEVLDVFGIGTIPFSPLAQGLLTDKYLNGIPEDSRAASEHSPFLDKDDVDKTIDQVRELNKIAQERGQTLAQMAVAWLWRFPVITSVLIGASKVRQIEDIVGAMNNANFSEDELNRIDAILKG
ncbi:MAG: L-glyceraldehyde 3-phosphate reductase [Chloroflexi bacterium]|nr:L-glyceraldehyde 3-phosphate reductase [Chloroflexota bacterium]